MLSGEEDSHHNITHPRQHSSRFITAAAINQGRVKTLANAVERKRFSFKTYCGGA